MGPTTSGIAQTILQFLDEFNLEIPVFSHSATLPSLDKHKLFYRVPPSDKKLIEVSLKDFSTISILTKLFMIARINFIKGRC